MERVLIIGSPGSGKSTLAAEVARLTGLPLVHLDQAYWRPGWLEPDRDEWAAEVSELIERPRWVMDGNYGGTMAQRLARADTVIQLDLPTWLCLTRVLRRTLRQFGRVRSDMPQGCPERLDWTFFAYTARFRRHSRPQNEARLAGFAGTRIRLRSRKEVGRFLKRLRESGPAA
jgi:adenylate kinase family enzyme